MIILTVWENFRRFGGPVLNAVSHTSEKPKAGTWILWHNS